MLLRERRLLAAAFLVGPIVTALAQPARAQSVPSIGPNQPPPTLPDYAAPPPSPPLAPIASSPVATAPDSAGQGQIAQVRIAANDEGRAAVPPSDWRVADDSGLDHATGEPLDRRWVERQFVRLTAAGPVAPSAAIGLVQQVNHAFASAGFVNSGLLIAGSDGPTLVLDLVYGRLASDTGQPGLTVGWNRDNSGGLSPAYVRRRFAAAGGTPLNALAIERDFRLLAEDPAIRSINAALRPGERPGLATLQVTVRPTRRVDAYATAANDRSPSVGGEQLFGGVTLRNLVGSGDLMAIEGGLTGGTERVQLAYSTPFVTTRTNLVMRGSVNRAAVTDRPLVPLDIRTRDRSVEAGITQSLLRTPLMPRSEAGEWDSSQSLTVGLFGVHRRQRSYLLGEPFSFAPGAVDGRTEYRAARLSADYLRRNVRSVIATSLTLTHGLGGTQSDIPSLPNPKDGFVSFLGNLAFARRLAGNGLELRGRLTGQWSGGTLYSSERLSIGGVNSVRGYRESLYLADRGIIASAELAYPLRLSERGSNALILSVFADGARFANAGVDRLPVKTIASVGVAAAWSPIPGIRLSAAYGHALKNVDLPKSRDLQDRGVHWRITVHPLDLF